MSSLHDLQSRMSEMIWGQDFGAMADQLGGESGRSAAGLAVYRNNVFASLTDALADTYPVIQRLVGEGFFKACARHYIREHPTSNPVLAFYGEHFADFLRTFEPATSLDYLPDVARLEYSWLEAYHAEDVAPIDMSALQALAPEQFAQVHLHLHRSVQLISSRFPIEQIWRANRPETLSDETIDLASGPQYVLAARPLRKVDVAAIDAGLFHFLVRLTEKADLTEALEKALAHEPDFDLQHHLGELFANHLIVNFDLG